LVANQQLDIQKQLRFCDFVDDQNSLTMEAVMAKHKPYTPEYKLSAVLDPDGNT
jgi:hypothetical protein